jgi:hypothetical protein
MSERQHTASVALLSDPRGISEPGAATRCRIYRDHAGRDFDLPSNPLNLNPQRMLLDPSRQQDFRLLLFSYLKGIGTGDALTLRMDVPRSRPEHLVSTYEIPSSGQIRQNPWGCSRRYKRRYSTCLDVLPLPHSFRGDLVPVYRRVQIGLDLVFVRAARRQFSSSRTNPSIIRSLQPLRWLLARPNPAPNPRDVPATPHMGPSLPNHMHSDRGDICCLDGAPLPGTDCGPVENPMPYCHKQSFYTV